MYIFPFRRSTGAIGAVYSDFGHGPSLFEPEWHDYHNTVHIDTYTGVFICPKDFFGQRSGLHAGGTHKVKATGIFAPLNGQTFCSREAVVAAAADLAAARGLVVVRGANDGICIRIR